MKKFFTTALAIIVASYSYSQTYLPITGGNFDFSGTAQTFVNFRNAGGDFYIGRESSAAGAFFTGSAAYANVLYSSSPIQNIVAGMNRFEVNNLGVNVYGTLTGTSATFNGTGVFNNSLSVVGPASDNIATGGYFYLTNHGAGLLNYASATQLGLNGSLDFWVHSPGTDGWGASPRMRITKSGNVGIGTMAPDSKLTVAGKIHSQEVKVTIAAGADFVFQKDYNLKPLKEVAAYIAANKHLPEIASAEEMKKNGLELGEMNIKLLQKIEELTLHLIEQNKRIEGQNKRIEELEKRNK